MPRERVFRANISALFFSCEITPLELKKIIFSLSSIDPLNVLPDSGVKLILCLNYVQPWSVYLLFTRFLVHQSACGSLYICLYVCVCVCVCPELGGACRQTSSPIGHPRSGWAFPPWHLPQCTETGNCQVTLDPLQGFCETEWKRVPRSITPFFVWF